MTSEGTPKLDDTSPAAERPQGAVARSIDQASNVLVTAALAASGLCVVVIIILGAWDTLGRLMSRPLMGAVEMTESLLATTIFLALPFAQRHGQHVVVDIIIQSFSKRWRLIAYFFALVLTCCAFILLAMQSYDGAVHSWRVGEVSAGYVPVPIWLAKLFATVGLVIAVLETIRQIIWTLLWPSQALTHKSATSAEGASLEQE